MGSEQTKGIKNSSDEQLIKKLVYVLTQTSKNFNEMKVYRLNEKPYDYFLRFRQSMMDSEAARDDIKLKRQLYGSLAGIKCLVKVEASQFNKVTELCSNSIQFDSFARYHNYTLEDAIQCKKNRNKRFKEGDLLYIMSSLLGVGSKITVILGKGFKGIFKTHRIYLSTEGYIRMYPFHLRPATGPMLTSPPQQIQTVGSQLEVSLTPKRGEENARTYKSDLKDIGLLILQLILVLKSDEMKGYTRQQLELLLDKKVGPGLKNLIIQLITSSSDYSYEIAQKQLQRIKEIEKIRPSYCIKLQEDISMRESQIMKRQQEQIYNKRQQNLMRLSTTINNNLVASRIEIVNRKSTQFTQNPS